MYIICGFYCTVKTPWLSGCVLTWTNGVLLWMTAAHGRCNTERSQRGNGSMAGVLRTLQFCLFPLGSGSVLFPVPSPRPCPFYPCLHPHPLTFHLSTSPFFMLCWHILQQQQQLCSSFQPPSYFLSHPSSNLGLWPRFPLWSLPTHISLFPEVLVPLCWFPALVWLVKGACPGMSQELRSYRRCDKMTAGERGQMRPKHQLKDE